MRMEESETIMEYNGRLKSLANEAFTLGDPISNKRLVSKVLRSVPKRFHTKVCAKDESKDTSIMGLDELISSLRTYEMEMEDEDDSKGKSIVFQVSNDVYNDFVEVKQEVKDSDLEENSIALISKKFIDYLKVMKEKKDVKSAQPSKFPKLPTSEKPQKPATTRGPRQRECKGYGHYAYECANCLRKGMNVSLSDDDSEEDQEKVEQADLISFTALLESKKNFQINPLGVGSGVAIPGRNTIQKSVADAYTLKGIQKLYEELYCDWIKRNQLNTILTKENTELKADLARLEVIMSKKDLELGLLNSELEKAKTTLSGFNSSSHKLDTLLSMGKNDNFGLGFKESVFETDESSKTPVFVKKGNDSLIYPSTASKGKKPIVEKNNSVPKPKQWKRPFVCHYCLKPGHIRLFCRKLKNDYVLWESKQVLPPVLHKTKSNTGRKRPTMKKVWIQKSDARYFVIYTSLKANTAGNWYFDSGSSRHMTGLKDHLTDYIEQNGGRVTYGGGAKGRIVGKGTLNVEGFPKFHNVLHVEGLIANLISISELCDDDLHVKFDKNTCEVFDNTNHCIIIGTRSVDNCYQLGEELACKQTRVVHPVLQHRGITQCLELLHMDLMGPMEVESHEVARIRTDHGKEFENSSFSSLCDKKGISQEFSAPKTPQQNDLKGNTAEDDVEGLLEIPSKEHSVVPDVTTPNTTMVPSKTVHEENFQNNEEAEMITEKDIPSKIQKNHPSSQIIGDVHGTRHTRAKDKVDYRNMVELKVYVKQPKGFENSHHLDHVYKLKKALYSLKQAPRAWYGFSDADWAGDVNDKKSTTVELSRCGVNLGRFGLKYLS
ncbi:uncharacterized protein [Henckelia pumila]|uniref:uncharacterized protein n=1 Tax=Henckelia pumila TaxID=405737 RepID=UPI003C6DDF68